MASEMTRKGFIGGMVATGAMASMASQPSSGGKRWYRGMIHMQTLWSDGRAWPEQAVAA